MKNISHRDNNKRKTKSNAVSFESGNGGGGVGVGVGGSDGASQNTNTPQMHPNGLEADHKTKNKMQNVTRILINATHPRQSNGKYKYNAF